MNPDQPSISVAVPIALPSPEQIEEMTRREIAAAVRERIDERIGLLTLEEAMPRLQCKSVRMVRDACARWRIPIVKLGAKKEFIRIGEIEAALKRREQFLPSAESRGGTTITPLSAVA
jgi:hypothetical protein